MNRFFSAVVLIGLLVIKPLFACEEDVTCDKCAKASEFSWNPSNQYVTTTLQRFYSLDDLITEAYTNNNFESAKELASEYLELAHIYRCNWNYGNAIHDANRILGLMSISSGYIDEAADYLLKAGKSAGSPQLDSFGPELDLANELLKRGKSNEVLSYLKDIRTFWEMDDGRIARWTKDIESGGQPELHRFSASAGFWQLVIFWVSALWPIFAAGLVLMALRNKIQRKWLFGAAAIVSGYITMFAVNWASTSMLPSIIGKMVQSGSDSALMLSIYAVLSAGYIIPLIVVFAVSRLFIPRHV
ncbi:MAG: hypothetical protein OQL11_05890 [Gammaproteobacteria bacterium]|nr:hypothetical protein [Gammaproteobacteria bacterium]